MTGRAEQLRSELGRALASAPRRAGLRFDELAIVVRGDFGPALDWIERYLAPWYALGPAEPSGAPVVGAFAAPALRRRLLDALAGAPATETQTHKWRPALRYELGPDLTVLVYGDGAGVTVSDRARRTFAYAGPPEDPTTTHEPVRIARELFTTLLLERRFVMLHAGAVTLPGGALVVCGPRGAGKTTLICGLLEHAHAGFLSNDRVYAGLDAAGEAVVLPWPQGSRLALGTCSASPRLRAWLVPGRGYACPQLDWDAPAGIDAVDAATIAAGAELDGQEPGMKVELTARELAAAMGTGIDTRATARWLVFPQIDLTGGATTLEPAEPDWAAERLVEELLSPEEEVYPDWLELRGGTRERALALAEEVAARLAAAGPSWRLRYHDPALAARVLSAATRDSQRPRSTVVEHSAAAERVVP